MTEQYRPREIELRWQARWRESWSPVTPGGTVVESGEDASEAASGEANPPPAGRPERGRRKSSRTKTHYVFPTPVSPEVDDRGWTEVRRFVAADVYARLQRLMGATTFLPAGLTLCGETLLRKAAAERLHPLEYARARWEPLLEVLAALGITPDVPGTVRDCDPEYVRWTQWIFLQFMRRELLFQAEPGTAAFLASTNGGSVESAGRDRAAAAGAFGDQPAPLEPPARPRRFWAVRVSGYGDRLLSDLGKSNWPIEDRNAQRYRIGRLRGCQLLLQSTNRFKLECEPLEVFTTRIETLHGVSFVLVHPWHPIVEQVAESGYEEEIAGYRKRVLQGVEPRISAVRTGGYAINPINLEKIPILVSRLAMEAERGPAILGVPAHHPVLFDLARRVKLRIREVLRGKGSRYDVHGRLVEPFTGEGVLTNSGPLNSLPQKVARERMINRLHRRSVCRRTTRFFLEQLPVSRPSPWGVPVPIVHCPSCGPAPVPEEELPVLPPEPDPEKLAQALDAGHDLGAFPGFLAATCPACGGSANRDPHVISEWVGRSWMFLRHLAPELAGEIPGMPGHPLEPVVAPSPGTEPAIASAEGAAAAQGEPPIPSPDEAEGAGDEEKPPELDVETLAEHALFEETQAAAGAPPPDTDPGDEPVESDLASDTGRADDRVDAREGPGAGPAAPAPAGAAGGSRGEGGGEAAAVEESRERDEGDGDEEAEEAHEDPRTPLFRKPSAFEPFRSAAVRQWLPVDTGLGLIGSGTVSILETRFLTKFLYDLRELPAYEPFYRFTRVGPVRFDPPAAGSGGAVTGGEAGPPSPRDLVEKYGADAVRLHVLSRVSIGRPLRFDERDVRALGRLLARIWREVHVRLREGKFVSRRVLVAKHMLIRDMTHSLRRFRFEKALTSVCSFLKFLKSPETTREEVDSSSLQTFLVLLWPLAPHMASELWGVAGGQGEIGDQPWPEASSELLTPQEVEIPVESDDRVRLRLTVPAGLSAERLENHVLQTDEVRARISDRVVKRVVAVPDAVVNILLEGPPAEGETAPS